MKFVRFGEWQTGLLLDIAATPEIVDVYASIVAGVAGSSELSDILADKGRGSWIPLIED